jgi:hypothetical protein
VRRVPKQPDGDVSSPEFRAAIALHNGLDLPVPASSDWIIDLGPGAGDEGGRIVAAGPLVSEASLPSRGRLSTGTICGVQRVIDRHGGFRSFGSGDDH